MGERPHYGPSGRTRTFDGITLRQIQALVDLPEHGIKAGDLGGWIQSPANLTNRAWADRDARILDSATVGATTLLTDESIVRGRAQVRIQGAVGDCTLITGFAQLIGQGFYGADALIASHARFGRDSTVMGGVVIDKPITVNDADITRNDHWAYQADFGPDQVHAGFARSHTPAGVCLFAGDQVFDGVDAFTQHLDALRSGPWARQDPAISQQWGGQYELLASRARAALDRWKRTTA